MFQLYNVLVEIHLGACVVDSGAWDFLEESAL